MTKFNSLICVFIIFIAQQSFADYHFVADWPQRAADAPEGSEFLASLEHLSPSLREQAIINAVLSGNVPDFMRELQPIKYEARSKLGAQITLTTFVTPDYLAIGSNEDYVRVPVNLHTAKIVAEQLNCLLPTRKMVNQIYKQAAIKLKPQPKRPGKAMTSIRYYAEHNETIASAVSRLQTSDSDLIAGHKKDIVNTRKYVQKPKAIAIYGWHKSPKKPIQPLSTVHGAYYADYSHGLRLIHSHGLIEQDGVFSRVELSKILTSPDLNQLLSDEGRFESSLFERKSRSLNSSI